MEKFESLLEFDKIKKCWEDLALTEWAKLQIRNTAPCMSETALLAKQRETTEAKTLLEKAGNPPLVSLSQIDTLLMAAEKEGCLSAAQLEEMECMLVAVKRIKDYLSRCKQFDIPLAYYEENLDALEELYMHIHTQIRAGRIEDSASKELKTIRNNIERARERMQERADSFLKAHKNWMSDNFSTNRNGHICVPVKKEYRSQAGGSVIDRSSTGNTLFMEPPGAARYYEELTILNIELENEERRILYTLTGKVADCAQALRDNIRVIEKLDYIFSKGKLSLQYEGVEPRIHTRRTICLKNARHPLMNPKTSVPLTFEMGNDIRGVVITGPNTGGKTVAIKTVALNCIMAQCGLHVACEEAAIGMSSNFLCDIGDGQNLSENLSTFSAHITNVMDILKKVGPDSLVIMDELGSGTDPAEGMGIAIAILEELKKSGALFLVTTHYPEVKQYAKNTAHIINARMAFDKESLKPLYQLVIGEAGESCAFYIAQRLGMPDFMLKTAMQAAYGTANETILMEAPQTEWKKEAAPKLEKRKTGTAQYQPSAVFQRGDSVMVYPMKKIGIVCQPENDKGFLQIQLQEHKIWVNHKRLKLVVAADALYPADYDFSIIFESVENRKLRHKMERKYVEDEKIVWKE